MTISPLFIVVMGVSGSGKSTIGRLASIALACPFLEGDTFHSTANVAKMKNGIPLQDADRWPWLTSLGASVGQIAAQGGLAIASCSALKRSYRDTLRTSAKCTTIFAYLRTPRAELNERVRKRENHYMPVSLLDSQLDTLEEPHPDEVARIFDSRQRIEDTMEEMLRWIETMRR